MRAHIVDNPDRAVSARDIAEPLQCGCSVVQDGVGIGTRNNVAGDKAIEERADDGHARVP